VSVQEADYDLPREELSCALQGLTMESVDTVHENVWEGRCEVPESQSDSGAKVWRQEVPCIDCDREVFYAEMPSRLQAEGMG
jgi:hypothetical protein